jgi:glycosyltransferase involved in cell wall biosynthesis
MGIPDRLFGSYAISLLEIEMKIGIIFPKDSIGYFVKDSGITFGGATVQLHQIATTIEGMGEDVVCMIPGSDKYREKIEVNYKYIDPYGKDDPLYAKIFGLLKSLKRLKPEYVFQRGMILSSILFAVMCRLIGIKFVFMFAHDIETRGFYQNSRKKAFLFRLLLICSHRLICQSSGQIENLPMIFHGKSFIIKKGVVPERISVHDAKYDAAWIARCEKWKRPHDFLELVRLNPQKRFLMVCSKMGNSHSFFDEISAKAAAYKNLEFNSFLENREVFERLSRTRVFCITSDMEGDWPMTVLEACSIGLPVLSIYFDNDGFLQHENGGYSCNGSIDVFNDNFNKLMTSESDYMEKSAAARMYIEKNYNIERNVSHLLEIIK